MEGSRSIQIERAPVSEETQAPVATQVSEPGMVVLGECVACRLPVLTWQAHGVVPDDHIRVFIHAWCVKMLNFVGLGTNNNGPN